MNAQRPVMFDGADYDLSQVGRIWRGGRQSAPWSGHAWPRPGRGSWPGSGIIFTLRKRAENKPSANRWD